MASLVIFLGILTVMSVYAAKKSEQLKPIMLKYLNDIKIQHKISQNRQTFHSMNNRPVIES